MATKFGIRSYSRSGNTVTFTVVALNANGTIDTGYTGTVSFVPSNMSAPANYTFTGADQGQRIFTAPIFDSSFPASVSAVSPDNSVDSAVLAVAGPFGGNFTSTASGDSLFVGANGNDTYNGAAGNELFRMEQAGNDTVNGSGGDDGFYFGGAYTVADVVNGGAGTRDSIGLQGNYSGGVTLGSMLETELVVLLPGNDTRFGDTGANSYDYNIVANASTIVSNNRLTIQANTLRVGEDLTFNGSASTAEILIYGGLGIDNLTGGSGNDGFLFGQGRFGASDVVHGGAGTLDQLGLQGNFNLTFGSAQMSGIEFIVLLSASNNRFGAGGGTVSYNLTMNDGNVASGQRMIIQGNTLRAGETLTFNGAAETGGGSFQIFSGAANDKLIGSAGADDIWGGAGDDSIRGGLNADTLQGAAGNDRFVYWAVNESSAAAQDTIRDFTTGDKIDLSFLDADSTTAGRQRFEFIGTEAFALGVAGQLRAVETQAGQWVLEGDVNGDQAADLVIRVNVTDASALDEADLLLGQESGAFPIGNELTFVNNASITRFGDLRDTNGDGSLDTANALGTHTRPSGQYMRVITVDVDNDGDLDIVSPFASSTQAGLTVYENKGDTTGDSIPEFVAYDAFTFSGQNLEEPNAISAADLNNDGLVDFFVSGGSGPSNDYILVNRGDTNGDGRVDLTQKIIVNPAEYSWGNLILDYNQDGLLDLVNTRWTSNKIDIYLGTGIDSQGIPTYAAAYTLPNMPIGLSQPASPRFGDMDNDGDLDIVISGWSSGRIYVLRASPDSNGDGFLEYTPQEIASIQNALELELADFDGDGDLDIAVAAGSVQVVLSNQSANGTLSFHAQSRAGNQYGLGVGDVDFDGDPDIVFANGSVWKNLGDTNSDGVADFQVSQPTGVVNQFRWDVVIADFYSVASGQQLAVKSDEVNYQGADFDGVQSTPARNHDVASGATELGLPGEVALFKKVDDLHSFRTPWDTHSDFLGIAPPNDFLL